jgi:hypothetical protein
MRLLGEDDLEEYCFGLTHAKKLFVLQEDIYKSKG